MTTVRQTYTKHYTTWQRSDSCTVNIYNMTTVRQMYCIITLYDVYRTTMWPSSCGIMLTVHLSNRRHVVWCLQYICLTVVILNNNYVLWRTNELNTSSDWCMCLMLRSRWKYDNAACWRRIVLQAINRHNINTLYTCLLRQWLCYSPTRMV